jgi:hypothetical protein
VEEMQKITNKTIDRQTELNSRDFEPYRFEGENKTGVRGQLMQYCENAFNELKPTVVNNLVKGIDEATRYRQYIFRRSEPAAVQKLADAGYSVSNSD